MACRLEKQGGYFQQPRQSQPRTTFPGREPNQVTERQCFRLEQSFPAWMIQKKKGQRDTKHKNYWTYKLLLTNTLPVCTGKKMHCAPQLSSFRSFKMTPGALILEKWGLGGHFGPKAASGLKLDWKCVLYSVTGT